MVPDANKVVDCVDHRPFEHKTKIMDYSKFENILLLGEGDFSFAKALRQVFEGHMTATECGSGTNIESRYGNCFLYDDDNNNDERDSMTILAGVDARSLATPECSCQEWTQQEWSAPHVFWIQDRPCFDLVVFNFPHTEKHGKASRLVRTLFKQLRLCVHAGQLPPHLVVEMRLRVLRDGKRVRAAYNHEESAAESQFVLIDKQPCDLERWKKLGYTHRMTKKNETCRDISCNVWRWRACSETRSDHH